MGVFLESLRLKEPFDHDSTGVKRASAVSPRTSGSIFAALNLADGVGILHVERIVTTENKPSRTDELMQVHKRLGGQV